MSHCENPYQNKTNEELLEEYARTKDLEIKQELTMRYMYVVKTICHPDARRVSELYAGRRHCSGRSDRADESAGQI